MLEQTIREFGNRIGIRELGFSEDHVIHLEVEGIGDLYIEELPQGIVIYLGKDVEKGSLKMYKKALTLCHYRQKNPFDTYVGLYEEDKMVFLVRIRYEEISESNLEKAIQFLNKLQEEIRNTNKI